VELFFAEAMRRQKKRERRAEMSAKKNRQLFQVTILLNFFKN